MHQVNSNIRLRRDYELFMTMTILYSFPDIPQEIRPDIPAFSD